MQSRQREVGGANRECVERWNWRKSTIELNRAIYSTSHLFSFPRSNESKMEALKHAITVDFCKLKTPGQLVITALCSHCSRFIFVLCSSRKRKWPDELRGLWGNVRWAGAWSSLCSTASVIRRWWLEPRWFPRCRARTAGGLHETSSGSLPGELRRLSGETSSLSCMFRITSYSNECNVAVLLAIPTSCTSNEWPQSRMNSSSQSIQSGFVIVDCRFRPKKHEMLMMIPSGQLWMESDNPENAYDSNIYGPVNLKSLKEIKLYSN